jgi:hypothetical protein
MNSNCISGSDLQSKSALMYLQLGKPQLIGRTGELSSNISVLSVASIATTRVDEQFCCWLTAALHVDHDA